ncbi:MULTISPECIES: hypothetical protein [Halopenitus]|uniref:Uncharacterized protein n=1 Tax=Halopenitus malekzadehii TaxID=1267564 RepID=A0A1H6HTR4_9EURY|nr:MULTISPECIES: hypothetical protein [Halopenitus]SEH38450.1 hypothetical protein SAMN05192561_101369 [Halopenitus malekzadehii]
MALASIVAGSGLLLAAAAAIAVYWDADRLGIARAPLWAAFVFSTVAVGLTLPVLIPTVPIAGTLVVLVMGPAIYAFERDDTLHGGDADPSSLPDEADGNDRD